MWRGTDLGKSGARRTEDWARLQLDVRAPHPVVGQASRLPVNPARPQRIRHSRCPACPRLHRLASTTAGRTDCPRETLLSTIADVFPLTSPPNSTTGENEKKRIGRSPNECWAPQRSAQLRRHGPRCDPVDARAGRKRSRERLSRDRPQASAWGQRPGRQAGGPSLVPVPMPFPLPVTMPFTLSVGPRVAAEAGGAVLRARWCMGSEVSVGGFGGGRVASILAVVRRRVVWDARSCWWRGQRKGIEVVHVKGARHPDRWHIPISDSV